MLIGRHRRALGSGLGRMAIASLGVVLVVTGIVVGGAIRTFRQGDTTSQVAASGSPIAPPSPSVPADWQVVTLHELRVPIPPGWPKTIDTVGKTDRAEADPPQILYFEDRAADPKAHRMLSIWIWSSTSVDDLVRRHFIDGNLSYISHATVPSVRPMREVVSRASWSGPSGSGSYRSRQLFVQVDARRVVGIAVIGPQVVSSESEPSAEMRSIQEIVAYNIEAVPPAGCPATRSTDQWGVITADGRTGILDGTYASAAAVNDSFDMVRRDAVVGERVGVRFDQVGTSAPARWVAYEVTGEPRPTRTGVVATPWDGAAFKLGVKPIGFTNSCWRLFVDGADSGIVLFVGP